jgi:Cof subfamily protein (haloacid dehalogenase superfamily)
VSAQSAGRELIACTAVPDRRELAQGALLVSDLDGTLLRPDGTLGLDTVEVINAFIGDGGLFTYATARSFTSASRAADALNLQLPVITYGGAIVVDPTGGETRQAQMLQPAVVSRVLEVTAESGIQPILFVMHEGHDRVCWLPDRTTPWIRHFLRRRPGDSRLMPLTDWSTLDLSAVFYVSLIASREPLTDLRAALGDVLSDCHVVLVEDIYDPGDWWLELTSVCGTKAAAVTILKTEIGAETLVCFGDNVNDLAMFAIADVSLAVGNAAPEIRRAATAVIDSNDAEGVAR